MRQKLCGIGIAISGMLAFGQLAMAAPDSTATSDSTLPVPDSTATPDSPVAPDSTVALPDSTAPAPQAAPGGAPMNVAPPLTILGKATLFFRNDVGNRFQIVDARFTLDNADLPTVVTQAQRGRNYVIYAGRLTSGRHHITCRVRLQGRDRGIFTYLHGYSLNVNTEKEIYSVSGSPTNLSVVVKDKKGFNVPFEKSVAVGFK